MWLTLPTWTGKQQARYDNSPTHPQPNCCHKQPGGRSHSFQGRASNTALGTLSRRQSRIRAISGGASGHHCLHRSLTAPMLARPGRGHYTCDTARVTGARYWGAAAALAVVSAAHHRVVHTAVSKYPTPGKSKTRLVPDLGKDGASAFAEAALTDIVKRFSVTTGAACGCCSVIRLTRLLFVHHSERLATLWCSHRAAPNALVCTSWCQRSIHCTCRVVKCCYMHPWSFTPSCVSCTDVAANVCRQ